MEDNKDMVKDTRDPVDNYTRTMVDTEVEKEKSLQPEDLQVENKELPHSKGTDVEIFASPHFEGPQIQNEGSPHSEGDQNPVEILNSCSENPDHAVVKQLELLKDVHSVKEQGLLKPSVVTVDPNIDAETNELHGNSKKTDGIIVDPCIQLEFSTPNERSLETKNEDETREELKSRVPGMELPLDNETKEDQLNNGVRGKELLPDIETEEEDMNNGVTGMKLLPHDATKEVELKNGVTGMEMPRDNETKEELNNCVTQMELPPGIETKEEINNAITGSSKKSFLLEPNTSGGDESGTEEEQAAFMKELETFHKERCLEFKPPRFYGEPLNCLKLWRAVITLGGYEQVTSCKLWRQVGESFKPPKTCTTVSWTFRCFYEKALLEYEKHKMRSGELPFSDASFTEPANAGNQVGHNPASGLGRARRDAAARAMQGWHSQRLLGNGEVGDPIIKDKNSTSTPKREKQLKSIGLPKRKKASPVERAVKVARLKSSKPQLDTMVVDIGPPADWVKINVQRTKDCFEVYALVPGLLREEVRVQSDPAGRLVISGQPEQLDNPWGVSPFKKVVSLPSRIDPHQTSAVVTLHGQLFVRVPFEQSDM
ncbi:hypothetical protein F0562_028385 [Nyssa sinensis]|uniref:ARID domain-containing protein n=1 Tax=Nyssa sinensis TaxID=561372 RepID=A0A5J5B290_9ASTE|nr:hypothetical protein F0562_028385 [Nyssa sinensis]